MAKEEVLDDRTTEPEVATEEVKTEEGAKVVPETTDAIKPETEKWRSLLPANMRNDKRLSGNSIGEAISKLLEKEPPKESEGKDQPVKTDAVEEYSFTNKFDEAVDPDGRLTKNVMDALKGLELPNDQVDKVLGAVGQSYKGYMDDLKKNGPEAKEKTLKTIWGDKYDNNKAASERAYKVLVKEGSPLQEMLKQTRQDIDPTVEMIFAEIGKTISETNPPLSHEASTGIKKQGWLNRENDKLPWKQ